MVKKYLLAFIFALAGIVASAQSKVGGKVVDAQTQSPEPGAVVQLFAGEVANSNMAGYAISDSLGLFTIKFNPAASGTEYIVQVVNMGRRTEERHFKLEGSSFDLGVIGLVDDVQALQSSKVTAAKPLIKMEADKIAYDVENDADSKANTVLEMLRKVPMVTVDGQDNITVNGSSSFKVYVDGKPNQMLSSNPSKIFKAMPASAVKSIEVITNPGAKYDAEGTGGVLNLITARTSNGSSAIPDGANGSIQAGIDTRGTSQGGLYLNAKKGKLTVGTNLFLGYQVMSDMDNVNKQYLKDSDLSLITSADIGNQTAPYLFGDINASYEKDSLNLITASLGLERWTYSQDASGETVANMAGAELYRYSGTQHASGGSKGLNASIDWQHSSARDKERMLTLSYRFSNSPELEFSETRYDQATGIVMPDRKVDGVSNSQEHTFQGDFTTPIAAGQSLSSGVKYIFRNNYSDDAYYLDKGAGYVLESEDDGYHHYNHIAAAYSEYAGAFGQFSLKAGLRYERTWLKVTYDNGTGYDGHYDNLVPNFSMQYNLGQTSNLGMTYNLRISRPGIGYLNPFIKRSNATEISYGNPDVQPEKTHNFALKYNFFSPKVMVNAGLNWRFGEGGIAQYNKYAPDPEDPSVMIMHSTYGNIVNTNTVGFNGFFNWNPLKDTRIYSNARFGYTVISSEVLNQRNSGWNGNFMLGAQQTIFWDMRLSANYFGNTRRYTLQGWSSGFNGAMVGLTKGFLEDKLDLTLRAFTTFDGPKVEFASHTEGNGFTLDNITHVPIRSIGFEISYNFGKSNFQVKKAQHTITNDDVVNAQSAAQQQSNQANMK